MVGDRDSVFKFVVGLQVRHEGVADEVDCKRPRVNWHGVVHGDEGGLILRGIAGGEDRTSLKPRVVYPCTSGLVHCTAGMLTPWKSPARIY